jgi:HD-GYP domain-containing protein (c-di-GMP phosphodiesterase class II)/DNA-binding CsgD family transcriptional regulator
VVVEGGTEVRLAELVAAASLAVDLGLGQPMEHLLRSCLISLRLAQEIGLVERERVVVYYVTLLGWVGCHADGHEQAVWFGDDIALKADRFEVDMVGAERVSFVLRHVGAGGGLVRRTRLLGSLAASRGEVAGAIEATHCRIAGDVAVGLGLGSAVADALLQVFERWDGKGTPTGLRGDRIAVASRLAQLALIAEYYRRLGGVPAAVEEAVRRRGTQFDPALVDRFCASAPRLLAGLDQTSSWGHVIDSEPALRPTLSGSQLDGALEGICDLADLKSPFMTGHSRGVAQLAGAAALRSGFSEQQVHTLRQAAMIHDLGRLGVSNAIWEKPGPLSAAELERVRMHPYYTLRMFSQTAALAPVAELASQHAERLDGSGYPRGLTATALSPSARLLAAVDVYRALVEPRAYRPAHQPPDAAKLLRAEVKAGRLDGGAVQAVIGAAGQPVSSRREWPAGLTGREVEVLSLLVRGSSNKTIAARLYISAKTVGTHVEHIYMKIGVSSRAEASLFAMQHGLAAG